MPSKQNHQFSIVIVTMAGDSALLGCLKSIAELPVEHVILASGPVGDQVNSYIEDKSMLLIIRPDLSVPERRAAGLEASSCEWVAVLEDTCVVSDTWFCAAAGIIDESSCAAASGPVHFSSLLAPDALALACSEYGRFTHRRLFPELAGGGEPESRDVDRTIGVNLFYRKDVIRPFIQSDGLIESELDAILVSRGCRIIVDPNLAVCLSTVPENSARIGTRFDHGRLYGGLLRKRTSIPARIWHLLRCFALPIVLSSRAIQSLPEGHVSRLGAIRHILGFETAWALGEFIGTLIGPGNARQSWK